MWCMRECGICARVCDVEWGVCAIVGEWDIFCVGCGVGSVCAWDVECVSLRCEVCARVWDLEWGVCVCVSVGCGVCECVCECGICA